MEALQFLPLLFPILLFGGMFFLISRINQYVFKVLLNRFDKVSQMPADSIKPEVFRFGNSILRNSVTIAEQGDTLLVKIMLIPAFAIPYSTFPSIQADKNIVTLKFKDELPPVYLVFRPGQLDKFPKLKAILSNAPTALPVKAKAVFKPDLPFATANSGQIKSAFGNIVRGTIAVALLIGAGLYAQSRWGIF